MRAMVVRSPGGPEALVLEDIPPPPLRRNDVRIRVEACGVCFHDIVTRNGTLKRGVEMPLIPGHEFSGIVEAADPDVRGFRPGDRVATLQRRHICGHCKFCRADQETACPEQEFLGDLGLNGGYAELVCVEEDNVAKVADAVALDTAAIIACTVGTELNAIRNVAGVKTGERVLVNGAGGGLGIHGVQIAHLSGAEVIAVTGSPQKVATIRKAGPITLFSTSAARIFRRKCMRSPPARAWTSRSTMSAATRSIRPAAASPGAAAGSSLAS